MVGRPFDANNAMTNATGKNGINHGVKVPLKIQTVLIQQEVVDTHDQHARFIVIRCRCIKIRKPVPTVKIYFLKLSYTPEMF